MRLTARDIAVLRDLSLSHVLSRDQLIALGYFGSVVRCNTSIRRLVANGLIRRIETPFFGQGLYAVRPAASEWVGERLRPLAAARTGSPRFLRHGLFVTNVRIAMLAKGAEWKFEQQLRVPFAYGGREWEIRPDGMALQDGLPVAVEADCCNVALSKIAAKLRSFEAWVASGECARRWGAPAFTLLVVTTGKLRASRIARLAQNQSGFRLVCRPHDRLGIELPGSWS